MKIIDVLTSPWAILPEKLYEIQEVYSTHLRGDKVDPKTFTALAQQVSPEQEKDNYQILNGIAVIPITGIIAKRMNLFTQISGGVSTQLIGRDITDALAAPDVRGIVLDIDSPGGTVDGTQELAQLILQGRDIKPIVAYSDGMIASAAYWIGSAAHRVYISGPTVHVGSIGVVATHVDYSEYDKKRGLKRTEIYAGKYKRIASQTKPLSQEGKQSIQDQVDYLYSIFVDAIAQNRGVGAQKVLNNMADGKIFIGEQAVRAGLVDGLVSFDGVISERLPLLGFATNERAKLTMFNNALKI